MSRELHAVWDRLRAGRGAPEWSDVDPAALRGILADVFVVEVDDLDAPLYPIRVAGARVEAFWTGGVRGASLPGLFDSADRAQALRVLRGVLDHQAPALAGLRAAPPGDHRGVDLEMLLLPLRHRGRTHARILGSVAPHRTPSWLGLTPVDRFELVSVRFPGDRGLDAAAPVGASPPRRRGHLRVYDGGRAEG